MSPFGLPGVGPDGVVAAYKNLAHVERDFRSIKVDDLHLRPIHHRLEDFVRADVLIAMLAAHLTWHLRRAWAPLTFTDHAPPARDNPGSPPPSAPPPPPAKHPDAATNTTSPCGPSAAS